MDRRTEECVAQLRERFGDAYAEEWVRGCERYMASRGHVPSLVQMTKNVPSKTHWMQGYIEETLPLELDDLTEGMRCCGQSYPSFAALMAHRRTHSR